MAGDQSRILPKAKSLGGSNGGPVGARPTQPGPLGPDQRRVSGATRGLHRPAGATVGPVADPRGAASDPRGCRREGCPRVWVRRRTDRKSTRLNSSHANISYAVFCLKKKTKPIEASMGQSDFPHLVSDIPIRPQRLTHPPRLLPSFAALTAVPTTVDSTPCPIFSLLT